MKVDIEKAAGLLALAWARYTVFYGCPPRGTRAQMAALLELAKTDQWELRKTAEPRQDQSNPKTIEDLLGECSECNRFQSYCDEHR